MGGFYANDREDKLIQVMVTRLLREFPWKHYRIDAGGKP